MTDRFDGLFAAALATAIAATAMFIAPSARADSTFDATIPSCNADPGYKEVFEALGRLTITDGDGHVLSRQSDVPFTTAGCVAHFSIDFDDTLLDQFLDSSITFHAELEACHDEDALCDFSDDTVLRPRPVVASGEPIHTLLDDINNRVIDDLAAETRAREAGDDALDAAKVNRYGGATINDGATVNGGATINDGATVNGGLAVYAGQTVEGGLSVYEGATVNGGLSVYEGQTVEGGLTVIDGLDVQGGQSVDGDLVVSNGNLSVDGDVSANQYLINECPEGLDVHTATFVHPTTGASTQLCASDFMNRNDVNLTVAEQLSSLAIAGCNAIANLPLDQVVGGMADLLPELLVIGLNYLGHYINIGIDEVLSALQTALNSAVNAVLSAVETAVNGVFTAYETAVNAFISLIDAVLDVYATVINGVVGGVNAIVNILNKVVDAVNTLPGVDIGKVSKVTGIVFDGFGLIDVDGADLPTLALDEDFSDTIPTLDDDDAANIQAVLETVVVEPFAFVFSLVQSDTCNQDTLATLVDFMVVGINLGISATDEDIDPDPALHLVTETDLVPVYTAATETCAELNAHVCSQDEIYLLVRGNHVGSPRDIGYEGGEWLSPAGQVVKDYKSPGGFNFAGTWPPIQVSVGKLLNMPPQPPYEFTRLNGIPSGRFQCCMSQL